VTEGVDVGVDADAGGHVLVAAGYGVRRAWHARVGIADPDENVEVFRERDFQVLATLVGSSLVLGQQHGRLGVEGDSAHLVCLCAFYLADAGAHDVVTSDFDYAFVEVDVGPAEGAGFSSAHAGGHDEPDEGAPLVVNGECRVGQAGGFGRGGWVGLGRALFRALGDFRGVGGQVFPADGG